MIISTHALREEGDGREQLHPDLFPISTHALREEGDPYRSVRPAAGTNFYPRPPRGGRHSTCQTWESNHLFLPTPSARRATRGEAVRKCRLQHFYPRPPRGGRP